MGWHLQPTAATARHYPDEAGAPEACFEARHEPDIIAQVQLRSDGHGYIHATMSRRAGTASAGIWRQLARELRAWGVRTLGWEHKGKDSSIDPARAWADTVAEG
jgi:hypothetical protein